MKTSILLTGVLLCTNVTLAEESGKELFNTLCLSCHTINPNKGITKVAPPIFAVIKHVKSAYPQREDFVQQIIDWVEYPDKDVSLMRGAIKKFGLMPKLPYKQEEVRKVAEFLYDKKSTLPTWYKKHYEEKHRQNKAK